MDTAVTVLSIECATLIIKAANRVVQIFEALQSKVAKQKKFWLSLCFFGNFGPKRDREGTMDTRREEVERRAEIIILTRHDVPLLPQ